MFIVVKKNNINNLEVTGKELITSFILLLGMGDLFFSVFFGITTPNTNMPVNELAENPAIIAPPPGGGCSGPVSSWGEIYYAYTWGWNNYGTGIFSVAAYSNSTLNSNLQGVFTNCNFVIHDSTNSATKITSFNPCTKQVFWNLTDPNVQVATISPDVVFHTTAYFTWDTDNVEITIDMNAGGLGVSGYYTGQNHSQIDWHNIAGLIAKFAGS
jgi:hypothetical protein